MCLLWREWTHPLQIYESLSFYLTLEMVLLRSHKHSEENMKTLESSKIFQRKLLHWWKLILNVNHGRKSYLEKTSRTSRSLCEIKIVCGMSVNEFKTDSLEVWMLGKTGIYGTSWCLLLMKATLENFRINLSKYLSFLYLSYDLWKKSLMLATSDKVAVVASESHSSDN